MTLFLQRPKRRYARRVTQYDKPSKYFGPIIVGKPITPQPKPEGPDWIGKRIGRSKVERK